VKPTAILAKYFREKDQSLTDFAKEIRALTPEDKAELAALAAIELGVEVEE
jgi:exonuclease VII large subunit